MNFAERAVLLPLYLPSERADAGAFVQLTCIVASGDLPLNFKWSFNSSTVDGDATSVSISRVSPQMSLLVLSAVTLDQAGNYTCHVSNQAGSASSSIHVKVNGNPRFNSTLFRSNSGDKNSPGICFLSSECCQLVDLSKQRGREQVQRAAFHNSNLID